MRYPRLLIATQNQGKLNEFRQLLNNVCEECIPLEQVTDKQAEEPFSTFLENALNKARHASNITQLPTIADDSGLIIPALMGEPGVFSSRYAATQRWSTQNNDTNNNKCLLSKLASISDRRAFYFCVLVLIDPKNKNCPIIADACWHGEIINQERGTNGFGYDPLFYIPEIKKTVAELTDLEKNSLSHRSKAIKELHTQIHKRQLY